MVSTPKIEFQVRRSDGRSLHVRALLFTSAIALMLPACNGSKARNAEGVAYQLHGRSDQALQSFQQAQVQDPKNPNVYYNIARVYHQRGLERNDTHLLQQAEAYYNLCLDYDSDMSHKDCYRALAVLLTETDRRDKAFTLLSRWAAAKPRAAEPKLELARLHEEHSQFSEARERLLEATAVDPTNPKAAAALGRVREQLAARMNNSEDQQREMAQAMTDYRRSLQGDRQQPEVAARLATLQSRYPRLDARAAPLDGRRMVEAFPSRNRPVPRALY